MSYAKNIDLSLGPNYAGLTLRAKLFDITGTQVGGNISTGFIAIGGGDYQWRYTSFPDGFYGSARFYDSADDSYLAFVGVSEDVGALTEEQAAQLDAIQAACAAFAPNGATTSSSILNGGKTITTYQGDDYTAGSPRGPLDWIAEDDDAWPDLTGATVLFTSRNKDSGEVELEVEGSIVNPAGPAKTIRVELTAAQTDELTPGSDVDGALPQKTNKFDVQITLASGEVWTPVYGGAPGIAGGHTIIERQSS